MVKALRRKGFYRFLANAGLGSTWPEEVDGALSHVEHTGDAPEGFSSGKIILKENK